MVEFVDLTLQLGDGGGDGLLVEPAEHGLMEPFVLALGRGTARAAGDRLDTQAGDVAHQLRRDGFNAIPLSVSSRCGTPRAAMPFLTTVNAAWLVSPEATSDATASRE